MCNVGRSTANAHRDFAGFLQVLFGLPRVGRATLAISPMVVHAMLAGIDPARGSWRTGEHDNRQAPGVRLNRSLDPHDSG